MCAWLAVTGVPPAAHCRKTDLFAIARHGNGKQVGLKAGKIRKAKNSRKHRDTLAVSCIRRYFRLYDDGKIKLTITVLTVRHKYIKEMPTMMAVSFMTLWSSWAFLLLVPFLKSASVHQTVTVFRRG